MARNTITEDIFQQMKADYTNGYTIDNIVEKYGFKKNTIKLHFNKHGIYFTNARKFTKKEINSISNNSVLQISTTKYNSPEKLSEFLFENFSEEISNQILFLSWKPSEKIFQNEFNLTINSIQLYLEKSKDIIATRRFFSKKWISNILRFFNFAKNFYQIEKGNKDVLIVASGPSLNNSITKIIENRKNIFIKEKHAVYMHVF